MQDADDHIHRKKSLPSGFVAQWCKWWGSVQPPFRANEDLQVDDELIHPAVTLREDWTALMVGGAHGVSQLVYGLGLCSPVHSHNTGMSESVWVQWLYDIMWVFNHLLRR